MRTNWSRILINCFMVALAEQLNAKIVRFHTYFAKKKCEILYIFREKNCEILKKCLYLRLKSILYIQKFWDIWKQIARFSSVRFTIRFRRLVNPHLYVDVYLTQYPSTIISTYLHFRRWKIDFIRMNCLMAVLTEGLKTSDESELPSAAFFPSVTLRVSS